MNVTVEIAKEGAGLAIEAIKKERLQLLDFQRKISRGEHEADHELWVQCQRAISALQKVEKELELKLSLA